MPKNMKIGWQLTNLLQKLGGLLFWPTLYNSDNNLMCIPDCHCYESASSARDFTEG